MASKFGLDGVDALREAAANVGLDIAAPPADFDDGADLVLVNPAGGRVMVAVKRISLASRDGLARRISDWNRRLARDSAVGVVVADRVTREAREVLRTADWGWLDLRGHLHIVGPGLFVDTEIPALKASSGRSAPLAGRVGAEVAVFLLLNPDEPAAVRPIAATLGRAASSVSDVLSSMRAAGLLDERRRAAVPELFWELAARWRPSRADVQTVPAPGGGAVNDALKFGFENVPDTTGWALSDTFAAATYGAPVAARSDLSTASEN